MDTQVKTDAEVKQEVATPETEQAELEKNIKTIVSSAVLASTKEATEKSVAEIKSEVKEFVESQLKAIEAKAGLYHPEVKDKRVGMNTYLRSFLSATLANDVQALKELHKVSTTKELTTDASGSPFGGYVVDRELSAEIRHLITEYGVARREFMTVQLSKNSYDANALATDVTVYWVDEAGSIPSTQVVLNQESLTLKKLSAIVTLTRELLEDQEIDLFAFIATRVAEGFAKFEDRAFFMGEGASDGANAGFTGILYAAGNEATMEGEEFSYLTAEDLLKMQDESPQWLAANGKYYMHRSVRNLVRALKDENGTPIYQSPSENGPATIWGRPVVEVEVMPSTGDSDSDTPFILYADLKKSSILGYKGAISVDRFNAGVVRNVAGNADINLITTDREAVRWVERVGAITILPSAATVLKTASGS